MVQITKKRYAGVLSAIAIASTSILLFLQNKIYWKRFLIFMVIGTVFGESWQLYVSYIDPSWPGWWYAPGKVFGYIGKVSYEDLVFYPICGAFFFCIKELIPKINIRTNCEANLSFFMILAFLTLLVFLFCEKGGMSIAFWFALPGLIMMLFNIEKINFVNFILTGVFIVVFATTWDLFVKDWIYVDHATMQHSKIWLTQSWAWIKHSPVEITPWFSIAGWLFIYNLADILSIRKRKD